MRVAYAVALLLLLTAGCARAKPDTPVAEPKTVATRPATPRAPARPAAPATPKTAPSVATTPAAAPPLDLKALTQQLRETKAIGIFTKITLKNQVDDLLDRFRDQALASAIVSSREAIWSVLADPKKFASLDV